MVTRFTYWSRAAYFSLAALMVAAVMAIVFMAGMSVFSSSTFWDTHGLVGHSGEGLLVLMLVLAFPSRLPRGNVRWLLLALLGLYMLQVMLPGLRSDAPSAAALHPVNALAIYAVSVAHARAAWSMLRASRRVTVPGTPPVTVEG